MAKVGEIRRGEASAGAKGPAGGGPDYARVFEAFGVELARGAGVVEDR